MTKAEIEPADNGSIIQIISAIAKEAGPLEKSKPGGVPFEFRGIDATINHLAPYLDKYGVIHTSRLVSKETTVRPFVNADNVPTGKALTQTDVVVEYTFWAPDGSFIKTEAAGLAQDHADRSAAQAQSVALRVALLQLFHLPTGDVEPEVNGERTQAKVNEHAATVTSRPAAKQATNYRAAIADLLADESNTLTGTDANRVLAEVSGTADPQQWNDAHMKAAYDALAASLSQ